MAYENVEALTLIAATGADINQRRFVTQGASGIAQSADGADAIGVSLEMYDDSEHTAGNATRSIPVAVNQGMRIEVEAGAAIAIGADVSSDAAGKAITSATGDAILGKALSAASADGEVIEVLFSKAGRLAT